MAEPLTFEFGLCLATLLKIMAEALFKIVGNYFDLIDWKGAYVSARRLYYDAKQVRHLSLLFVSTCADIFISYCEAADQLHTYTRACVCVCVCDRNWFLITQPRSFN